MTSYNVVTLSLTVNPGKNSKTRDRHRACFAEKNLERSVALFVYVLVLWIFFRKARSVTVPKYGIYFRSARDIFAHIGICHSKFTSKSRPSDTLSAQVSIKTLSSTVSQRQVPCTYSYILAFWYECSHFRAIYYPRFSLLPFSLPSNPDSRTHYLSAIFGQFKPFLADFGLVLGFQGVIRALQGIFQGKIGIINGTYDRYSFKVHWKQTTGSS